MGSTAQIIGRVAAGAVTFGGSEVVRALVKPVGRAIGVDSKSLSRGLSAVQTAGASEAIREGSKAAGKAIGVDPVLVEQGATLGRTGSTLSVNNTLLGNTVETPLNKGAEVAGAFAPDVAPPTDTTPKTDFQTDADREREARLAREKRKRQFQNLGRSSTILTGGGGLVGQGAGSSKSLLGL